MRSARPSEGDDGEVVQAFVGDTLEEAMAAAVAALGPELVVRRARKVRTGLSGLLGKDRYEVLALPDPEASADPAYAVESALEALLDRADALESGAPVPAPAPLPVAPSPARRRPSLDLAPAPRSSDDAPNGRAGVRRARASGPAGLASDTAHPDPDLADHAGHAAPNGSAQPLPQDLAPRDPEPFPRPAAAREAARREVAREARLAREAQAAESAASSSTALPATAARAAEQTDDQPAGQFAAGQFAAEQERAERELAAREAAAQEQTAAREQAARQERSEQEAAEEAAARAAEHERALRSAARRQAAERDAAAARAEADAAARDEQERQRAEDEQARQRAQAEEAERPGAARRTGVARRSPARAAAEAEPRPSTAVARRPSRRHGWSVSALDRLGVPAPVLDALVAPRPGDDLAWIVALSSAIGTVVPEPAEPDESNPVVVSGYGLVGALSILDAGARGMTPGTISYGERTAPATSAELALALRHHLDNG